MPEELIRADNSLRKKTIVLLVIFVLGLMLLSPYLNNRLAAWRQAAADNPETALARYSALFQWLLGITALLVSAASLYLMVVAVRVLKTEQYPPPGLKVLRDTRLQTGRRARITAYVLLVNSIILIVLVTLIFLLFTTLVSRVRTPAAPAVGPLSYSETRR
jgi:heme/copper-type cytochrome/quinol oxidase subunit 3